MESYENPERIVGACEQIKEIMNRKGEMNEGRVCSEWQTRHIQRPTPQTLKQRFTTTKLYFKTSEQ